MILNGSVVLESDLNPALKLVSSTRLARAPLSTPPPVGGEGGGGGVVFVCFEEARVGECSWVEKVVSRASF